MKFYLPSISKPTSSLLLLLFLSIAQFTPTVDANNIRFGGGHKRTHKHMKERYFSNSDSNGNSNNSNDYEIGVKDARIIGGNPSERNEFPYYGEFQKQQQPE